MNDIEDTKIIPKKRFQRKALHLEVVDAVRDMIVEGVLPQGHRISEGDLCGQLGISRTPMREALKVLASEGMVEIKPNRGTRVSQITLEDIGQLFEAVGSIECICGELATEKMSDGELRNLRSLNDRMTAHFNNGNRHEYFRLNQDIHNSIVELSRNSVLREVHQNIMIKVRRARYQAILSDERWKESMKEHDEILAAIESRNIEMVGKLIKEHVLKTGETIKQFFKADKSEQ